LTESAGKGGGGGGTCLVVSCARTAPELKTKADANTIAQAIGMRRSFLNPLRVVGFSCFNIWFCDLGKVDNEFCCRMNNNLVFHKLHALKYIGSFVLIKAALNRADIV